MCRAYRFPRIDVLALFGIFLAVAIASAGCRRNRSCDDATSNAAKLLRDAIEDNQLAVRRAQLDVDQAETVGPSLAVEKDSFGRGLRLLVEALDCKNKDRCCERFVALAYAPRRERAMTIASVVPHDVKLPASLSAPVSQLTDAAMRMSTNAEGEVNKTELLASCEALRSQLARVVAANETAWADNEAAARRAVDDARAVVAQTRARAELLESWRQAAVARRSIDVAPSGEPGAPPLFRMAREAMIAFRNACD